MPQYLSDQDYQDYGSDLVSFSKRAALDVVAPQLQNLEAQNHELQRRLAREARHRMDAAVEAAIPNYRTIDQDPLWHQFLLTVDPLSGRQRQVLLNDAIANADAGRAIAFFRTFLQQGGATSHASSHGSSYGARRAASSANGPIYTGEQIKRLYEQNRRGAYRGREQQWAEGRVMALPYVTK